MNAGKADNFYTKGLVVAGMGGGAGKSIVAVSLAAAFRRRGKCVVPYKKGPDYIDAGWLQLASKNNCYNLDPYLMSNEAILDSFRKHLWSSDIVVIEGNRGLYDGVDAEGSYSTAELSIFLNLPVLLVIDCTKTTRTVAAMVLGCQKLDPRVNIRGVVLNRIGSARHEKIIRQAVTEYTGLPVLGALQRMSNDVFPQRHLGVTPHQEHENADEIATMLADLAEKKLELDGIEHIMADIKKQRISSYTSNEITSLKKVQIGVLKDSVFQFYYPDNLEALQKQGAEIVEINALTAKELPELDGLYIGGGFPETSAHQLSANQQFRDSVKMQIKAGLPVYAECGGLIYLGQSIVLGKKEYPLAGIFPVRFGLQKKPQAHGYTVLQVSKENPFYLPGMEIKGHEFRYSSVQDWQGNPADLVLTMERGVGFKGGRDGLVYKNVLALYTHIHAAGTPQWASCFVGKVREYQGQRKI